MADFSTVKEGLISIVEIFTSNFISYSF